MGVLVGGGSEEQKVENSSYAERTNTLRQYFQAVKNLIIIRHCGNNTRFFFSTFAVLHDCYCPFAPNNLSRILLGVLAAPGLRKVQTERKRAWLRGGNTKALRKRSGQRKDNWRNNFSSWKRSRSEDGMLSYVVHCSQKLEGTKVAQFRKRSYMSVCVFCLWENFRASILITCILCSVYELLFFLYPFNFSLVLCALPFFQCIVGFHCFLCSRRTWETDTMSMHRRIRHGTENILHWKDTALSWNFFTCHDFIFFFFHSGRNGTNPKSQECFFFFAFPSTSVFHDEAHEPSLGITITISLFSTADQIWWNERTLDDRGWQGKLKNIVDKFEVMYPEGVNFTPGAKDLDLV